MTGYAVLFFATRGLVPDWIQARRLLAGTTIATSVVATYAVIQFMGADVLTWNRIGAVGGFLRPFASLGNPNHLAAFLVMSLPLCAYFACRAARPRNWLTLGTALLTCVLSIFVILVSFSRGAWIALVCSLAVPTIVWVVRQRHRNVEGEKQPFPTSVHLRRAAIVFSVLFVGLVLVSSFLPFTHELEGHIIERVRQLSHSPGRAHIWRTGLALFSERPILGWGPDAFQLSFPRYRTPEFWQVEWSATPARAHNEVIHLLATQGLLGIAAAGLFLAGLARASWRAWQRCTLEERPLLLAVIAGTIGFCVQNLFSFTVIGCGTLFVTFAALLSRGGGSLKARTPCDHSSDFRIGVLVAAVLVVLVFVQNLGPALTEARLAGWLGSLSLMTVVVLTTLAAYRYDCIQGTVSSWPGSGSEGDKALHGGSRPMHAVLQTAIWVGALILILEFVIQPFRASQAAGVGSQLRPHDPRQALMSLEKAAAIEPGREIYCVELGRTAEAGAETTMDMQVQRRFLQQARQAFEQSVELVPANAFNHANLGRVLARLARLGLASPDQAYAEFDKALALDWANGLIHLEEARSAFDLGDFARARVCCRRGEQMYPFHPLFRAQLAWIELMGGRIEVAVRFFLESMAMNWDHEWDNGPTITAGFPIALYRLGRLEEALTTSAALLLLFPDCADARAARVGALEQLGRRDEAYAEYRRLDQSPDHAAVVQALLRLRVMKPIQRR